MAYDPDGRMVMSDDQRFLAVRCCGVLQAKAVALASILGLG